MSTPLCTATQVKANIINITMFEVEERAISKVKANKKFKASILLL